MIEHRAALPGPDDITRRELPNGVVVLARRNPSAPSVVITGAVQAGALFDSPQALGRAAFTASMLLRGTEQHDFAAINELLEGSGASLSLSAGRHSVGFGGKSLAEDLPLLLGLLAEALRRPTFPPLYVERLRGQLLTAIKIREQDTRYVAAQEFRRLAYPPDHPYHYATDGTVETVSALMRDDLAAFRQQHYGPRGMVVVVVGAVEPERAVELVAEKLGDWQNPAQSPAPDLPALEPFGVARIETRVLPGKSQSDLVLGWPGPSRFADDWHAANLANSVLGQFGMYGRIGAEVREKRGMAYYSYSRLDGGMGPGPWRVVAGVNPANVRGALEAIRGEIARMMRAPVEPDELADSKANFVLRMPLQLESNDGVAGAILSMERYALGLDYLRRYPDEIRAITAEDVLLAAQRYLDPDVYALGIAGPELPPQE